MKTSPEPTSLTATERAIARALAAALVREMRAEVKDAADAPGKAAA